MPGRFSVEAIFTATDRMTRPMAKITTQAERLTRSVRGFGASLRGFDTHLGNLHNMIKGNVLALGGLGVAAGFVGKNIFDAGAGFEQAMSAVAAVSLKTRAEVKDLELEAKRLGATTKFTATEVANAMELMGRAGFENTQILKGIGGVLSAAAAEGMEIADAASIVSNAIKGMGLSVDTDTRRVADVLALASARTNSSMVSLGESLSNVAATARDFKVPFESTVAAVALLQDVGLDASVAGTSLNTMLTRLATPTAAVRAQMRSLGIAFQTAKGDMLPIEQVLANVLVGLQKSGGNIKQAAFVADLFGMYGQKAAKNLAELARKGDFAKLVSELEKAAVATESVAEQMSSTRMDNALGDWEKFSGAIDAVKIELFELESGPLRKTIQGWTQWVDANRDLIVSNVGDFLVTLKRELPTIATWLKRIGIGLTVFYGLAAAVKAARVATAAFQLTLTAYTLVAKGAALATARFGMATRASTSAAVAGEAASKAYATALAGWSAASSGAAAQSLTLAGRLGKVMKLLGKGGLLTAAALVGFEFGTWIDKTTGLSERIAKWLADITGVNAELEKAGGYASGRGMGAGGKVEAPSVKQEWGWRGFLEAMARGGAPEGAMAGAGFGMSVMGPEERVSTSTKREEVQVTIKDETGRAEVKRKAPPGGSRVKVTPTGRF